MLKCIYAIFVKNFCLCLAAAIISSGISYADFIEEASLPFTRVDVSSAVSDALKLKGGPLRILYIGQRDVVGKLSLDISKLIECSFETILTESRTQIGLPASNMENEAEILSAEAIEKRAGVLFREDWDVLWLDFQFDALSEGFRFTILDRVEKGAGLVYVGDRRDIRKVARGKSVDDNQLKAVTFVNIEPECLGKRKQGSVVVMPPFNMASSAFEAENYAFSAVNTIVFSTQPDDGISITEVPKAGKDIELESISIMNYRLHVYNNGDSRTMNFNVRYRDEHGEYVSKSTNSYSIEKGKSFVTIGYPYLPQGAYSLEISVTDQEGAVAFAGTNFTVSTRNKITGIDIWEMHAEDGGYVMGSINVALPFTETVNLKVELFDSRGHLFDVKEVLPDLNMKTTEFAFKIGNTNERVVFARASLISSNKLIHKLEKPAFLRRMYDPRSFSLVVADNHATEPLSLERYKILREAGVSHLVIDMTQFTDPGDVFQTASFAASSGASIIPRITSIESTIQGDVTEPVFTTVEFNDELEQRVYTLADTLRYIQFPAFSLGRDNKLTQYEEDVSFSETDIESFRMYLESKYDSIENLNAAWNTNLSSFNQAQPMKFDEAKRQNAFEVWLDTRLHMEEVFTQVHYGAYEMFGDTVSNTKVGIEGLEKSWSPFRGHNLFELTGFLTMAAPGHDAGPGLSGDISVSAALASFASPGSFTGLSVGGETCFRGNEQLLRAAPWQSLFLGMNSIWWRKAFGGVEAALTPQYSLSPAFSAVAEESREIMGGIDILLRGSERRVDTIAILYSPTSKIASYTSSEDYSLNEYSTSVLSFYHACRDGGYTPQFVAEAQLTGAWLSESKLSVLILPYVQAVSDEAAQCIKEFVMNGGAVIADRRPGVMNGHLSMRETGVLNEVFGISQGVNRIAPLTVGALVPRSIEGGIPLEYSFGGCSNDPSVKAMEGIHVMASAGDAPAVIVNRYGNGTGILFNIGMGTYQKMRSEGRETPFQQIIRYCLYTGGKTQPYCAVRDSTGTLAKGIGITAFIDDTLEYVGILADPSINTDNSTPDEYFLDLSGIGAASFVYDIRRAKFLGANVRIPVDLQPGRAELFALIPYRVKGIELKLKSPIVKTGSTLEYSVAVTTQKKVSKPGRHVFRTEVTGPDGNLRPYMSRSHDGLKGVVSSSLQMYKDDSPGRWLLTVTDVITGKKAERAFMVLASGSSMSE